MADWEEREHSEGAAEQLSDEDLNRLIEEMCLSKAEEFALLGYENVSGKDIWDCVSSRYKEFPPLHRIVNDILSLKATDLMNWMTLSAWRQAERAKPE